MSRGRAALWALAVTAGVVLIFGLVSLVSGAVDPGGLSRDDQCEALRVSSVMEPQNTWSNIGYFYAGALILFRCLDSSRILPLAVGAALMLLGIFSGLYHAQPVSDTLRHLDVAGVYIVLFLLIGYGVNALFVPSARAPWVLVAILAAASLGLGLLIAFENLISSTVLGAILITVLVLGFGFVLGFASISVTERVVTLVVAAVTLGVSLMCRLGDGPGHFLCSADGALQAHATWHFFGALALLTAYDLFSRRMEDEGTIIPAP